MQSVLFVNTYRRALRGIDSGRSPAILSEGKPLKFAIVLVGPEKNEVFGAKTSAKLDPLTSPPGFAGKTMVVWRFLEISGS